MDFVVAVVATLLAMRHAFLQLVMLSPPHRERHIREAPPGMRATGSMHVWRFSCEVRRQAHGRMVSTSTRENHVLFRKQVLNWEYFLSIPSLISAATSYSSNVRNTESITL